MTLGRFTIGADHPSLTGHFPGNPIVPGVVLLDEALALIGLHHGAAATSMRVKFTAVVRAGEAIELDASEAAGAVSFTARHGDRTVMSGTLQLATAG